MKKTPYVKTKFGKWEFTSKKETCFVLPGDDENFAYVYRETQLKALIDIIDPSKVSPFNASFDALAPIDHKYQVSVISPHSSNFSSQENEVYVGNHLDFSIRRYSRQQNKVQVISSHLTKYIINANGSATRDTQVQTDFTLEQVPNNFVDSVEDFKKTNHEVRGLKTGLSVDMIFDQDKEWLLPLFNLTRVCLGLSQKGGALRKYHNYRNKKHLVRQGKNGGEYIIVDQKRKYLRKHYGGNILDIENIVMSEKFHELLYEIFLFPMQEVKRNIVGMQVIFDYGQELTQYKDSLHLVLMYEFDDGQKVDIFVIDGDTFLHAIEETNDITIDVRPNLERVAKMAQRCKNILASSEQESKSIVETY
jgi:hypothetical protein